MLSAAVTEGLRALRHGAAAVVAVSGGADSAALLLLTGLARPDLALTAVHVRHGLRDDAQDAATAGALADHLGVALRVVVVVVEPDGRGQEAAARDARYRALAGVAADSGAAAVLVGHTLDDQAETVLLALGRGTGLGGLGGMRPVAPLPGPPPQGPQPMPSHAGERVLVVRPLLGLRRAQVRAAVIAAGLPWITDPTNADPHQRRTRVRDEVLPALGRLSGGPPGDPARLLARMADLLRDDADLLSAQATEAADRMLEHWGPTVVVRRAAVHALHPALARRVVRTMLARVRSGGVEGLGAAAIARVLELRDAGAVQVPGGATVSAGGGWLTATPAERSDLSDRVLPVPGRTALPELGLVLVAEAADRLPGPAAPPPPAARPPHAPGRAMTLVVDLPAGPLTLRAPRRHDRAPGRSAALADLLRDLGVPGAVRSLLPVVADAGDAVLWVPGLAVPRDAGQGRHRLRLAPLPTSTTLRPTAAAGEAGGLGA